MKKRLNSVLRYYQTPVCVVTVVATIFVWLQSIINLKTKTIMATIENGILGPVTGKIGPVTTYMRNGKNVARTRRSVVDYKPTALRVAQLEKIKVCNAFTMAFKGTKFFNKSFSAYGETNTGYNRASSALMNLAIAGTYPDLYLSYPHVLVSKGKLPAAENASVSVTDEGDILFMFDDNSGTGTASKKDTAILVAYAPELQQAVFTLKGGIRAQGEALLQASALNGYIVETWLGFLSNDELNASNSVYTGRLEL